MHKREPDTRQPGLEQHTSGAAPRLAAARTEHRCTSRHDPITGGGLAGDWLARRRQFVAAGGLLLAGPDPTGNGGVIPGFGDLREIELSIR